MKKVLYLHGLESKQGGRKVGFLSSQAAVFAPSIDYRDNDLHMKIFDMISRLKPDLIIGSSMGGYVGDEFSRFFNIPAILLNPAIHSRSFEPNLDKFALGFNETDETKKIVVLGMDDEIINPERTKQMLSSDERYVIEEIEGMEHRTELDVFINIYNKYKDGI